MPFPIHSQKNSSEASHLHNNTGVKRHQIRHSFSTFISVLAFLVAWAAPATASNLCNPCVASIVPGTEEAQINLLDWLVPLDYVLVVVVEPPVLGTWHSPTQTYTPSDDFWIMGGDSITFRVYTQSGTYDGLKTLTLAPTYTQSSEDTYFDFHQNPMDYPSYWVYNGPFPDQALVMPDSERPPESEIEICVIGGETAYLEADINGHHGGGDPNAVAGIIEVAVTDPPTGPTLPELKATLLELDGLVRIEVDRDYLAPTYTAKAVFNDSRFDCTASCETTVANLNSHKTHIMYIDAGEPVFGPANATPWNLKLVIEEVQPDGSTLEVSNESVSAPKLSSNWDFPTNPVDLMTKVGVIDTHGTQGGGKFTVKWLETQSRFNTPSGQTTFAGFNPDTPAQGLILSFADLEEDGLIGSGSNSTGDEHGVAYLEDVVPLATPQGFAISVPVDAINRAVWTSNAPAGSREITAMVSIDSSSADIPIGTTTGVIELGLNDSIGQIAGNVILKVDHLGQRSVATQIIEDGSYQITPYIPVTSEPINIALKWRQGDTTSGGSAELWVNGTRESLTNIDNDHLSVERVTMGLTRLRYSNNPSGNPMPITFDNFLVRYK